MIRVFVEAWLLDGTAAVLLVEDRAALAAAYVLQSTSHLSPQFSYTI